MMKMLHVT